MKKLLVIALGIMCVAGMVLAGSSGVSNPVRKDQQPGFGSNSLQSKLVEFGDDVVTELDAIQDGAGFTVVSNSALVVYATNGTFLGSLDVTGTLTAGAISASGTNYAGDLAVSGDMTVTSNLTVSLVADADSLTVDAAGLGVDVQSAGKLNIGITDANAIDVGITAVTTDILGLLNVTEAASFDAAVVMDTTLAVDGTAITLEGSKLLDTGYFIVDANGTGANTNNLFSIGATFVIGDDGDGTLIETNAATAAEFSIGVLINGDRYNILLEKP